MRRVALSALLSLCGGVHAEETPASGDWTFEALLDGRPIGQHHFSVVAKGDDRMVTSRADFVVKLLGITVYHYQHQDSEQWHGNCLTTLESKTDDDGKISHVSESPGTDHDCVMSFAYWNPAITTQTRLLNSQTGKIEQVHVQDVGKGSVEVSGKPVEATQYRITGPQNPISVWYATDGRWVGLDSTVAGGRKLSYRIQ